METEGLVKDGSGKPRQRGSGDLPVTAAANDRVGPAGSGTEVEDQRQILLERARILAQEPQAENTGEVLVVVEFILGQEHYGIESTLVREVYPLKEYTPLPGTPPFILGVMNLRGQIVSITDIRKFFDLAATGLTNLNRVIILKNHEREFGILADDIVGMRSIPLKVLQTTLPTLGGVRALYFKGVTPDRLVVLAGEKILTDDRLLVHMEIE